MAKMDLMFSAILKKENGILIPIDRNGDMQHKAFIDLIEEGQYVEVFYDANEDDRTLPQLAKIHKCIKILSKHIGYTVSEMKLEVKKKAGLCIKKTDGENIYTRCKSFSKCSKSDLMLVLEAINELGDFHGINFR
jgi:hypothetical protein